MDKNDPDWVTTPLDLLMGYTPGMRLPTNHGKWHTENWHPNKPVVTEERWWLTVGLGHMTQVKHRYHRIVKMMDKRLAEPAKLAAARAIVDRLINLGELDVSDVPDNEAKERAKEALAFGVSIIKDGGQSVKDRIAAARMVLDFSAAKPATKSDVTIKSAEDWLDSLGE